MKIDFYKTAEKISKELRDDPELKIYTDEDIGFKVSIVKMAGDKKQNQAKIMTYIKSNKSKPKKDQTALFVYNGMGADAKLIEASKLELSTANVVVKANNLTMINQEPK